MYEQLGGRPGRRAIEEVTQTILSIETCRLQRLTGGITYNDAKACYDRITENLSNMMCLREGLPIEIAKLHTQTTSNMKYYMKPQKGIGEIPNTHSIEHPFYGVGQGAGDSPSRWGFISDNLIRAYNRHSNPAIIESPISHQTTNFRIQAFETTAGCS
jgi:hypothetical protein